jgi:hypothetical protein
MFLRGHTIILVSAFFGNFGYTYRSDCNPDFGQSDRAGDRQHMDQCAVCPNLKPNPGYGQSDRTEVH